MSGVKKMDQRLRGIVAKTRPPPELRAAIEPLLATLSVKLTTKRLYEDVFSTPEDAEGFAMRHALPDAEKRLLLLMQNRKSLYVPNALLDNVLTAVFFLEIALLLYSMFEASMLVVFILLLVLSDAVISRLKDLGQLTGQAMSTWFFRHGFVDCDPLSGKIQLKKWTNQSWQLAVHVACTLVELHILSSEPWYDDPATCWTPLPGEQRGHHSLELQLLYVGSLAIWVYTCIIHRFVDERKRDYFVLYLHHIVTIALVGLSWHVNLLRVGMLVMYVHDVSDIFIDVLKMTNLLKLEGRQGWFASEAVYVSSVVSWIYYRLYQFPFRVMHSSCVLAYRASMAAGSDQGFLGVFAEDLPFLFHNNVLLASLLGMHVYWFYLLAMVGYRIATESAAQASRIEYEGESDVEDSVPDSPLPAQSPLASPPDSADEGFRADGGGRADAVPSHPVYSRSAPAPSPSKKRGPLAAQGGGCGGST